MSFAASFAFCAFVSPLLPSICSASPRAQVGVETQGDLNTERYLKILRRRPRPGLALDRFHFSLSQSGRLNEVIQSLQTDGSQSEQAGRDRLAAGLLEMRQGNASEALRLFSEADESLPEDPGPPWGRGTAHLKLGELAEAIQAFDEALRRQPAVAESIEVLFSRGRALIRSDRIEAAEQNWDRLMNLDPQDISIPTRISDLLIEEQRGGLAVDLLRGLLREASSVDLQIEYRRRLAEAMVQMKQIESAIEEFQTILPMLSSDSGRANEIRNRLDELLRAHLPPTRRREFYERWIKSDGTNPDIQLRLMDVLIELGETSKAEDILLRLMENAPSRLDLRERYVALLRSTNRLPESISQQQELVAAQPTNLDYQEQLGRLWLEHPDLSESEGRQRATDVWLKSRSVADEDPVRLSRIAGWLAEVSRHKEALELYTAAIRAAPDDPTWRELLGAFHHEQGDRELAIQEWSRIAEGARRSVDSLFDLADVFRQFGYGEEASEVIRRAGREFPSLRTHLRCARFFDRTLQYDASLSELRQAESFIAGPQDRELWEAAMGQALQQAVVRQLQQGEPGRAVEYQRQLWKVKQNEDTQRELAKLLLVQASLLQRRQRPQDAVPLHLEAIRLDSELYAEDFETHIQTFEHARALPQLLDVLPAVELSPFEDSARLIVRLCADVLRDHPDSAAAPKLVPHLLQIFPSQRSQLRDDAQKLGLPFAESSEGGGHGEK